MDESQFTESHKHEQFHLRFQRSMLGKDWNNLNNPEKKNRIMYTISEERKFRFNLKRLPKTTK
ncbi:hypothetical protein Mapa_012666 [Marchantia paleacea]|nr:hypothetical protein Mapa_012666 [Marchantia paleacea]